MKPTHYPLHEPILFLPKSILLPEDTHTSPLSPLNKTAHLPIRQWFQLSILTRIIQWATGITTSITRCPSIHNRLPATCWLTCLPNSTTFGNWICLRPTVLIKWLIITEVAFVCLPACFEWMNVCSYVFCVSIECSSCGWTTECTRSGYATTISPVARSQHWQSGVILRNSGNDDRHQAFEMKIAAATIVIKPTNNTPNPIFFEGDNTAVIFVPTSSSPPVFPDEDGGRTVPSSLSSAAGWKVLYSMSSCMMCMMPKSKGEKTWE